MKKKNKKNSTSPNISLFKGVILILLSTLLVSGSASIALSYYRHQRFLRVHDDKYQLVAIVQTGPEKEALKTVFLAELLELSLDQPTNLYNINTYEAVKKLLKCPVIKEASIKKIPPGTLYIDYTVRQPVAYLGDFKNASLDKEGTVFPFKPFFTPKRLPEIYLGDFTSDASEDNPLPKHWGEKISGSRGPLALELLNIINVNCCSKDIRVSRIDVSKATYPSGGQREIIVIFEDLMERDINGNTETRTFNRVLRLSPENYYQELANYMKLRETLVKREANLTESDQSQSIVIDLRLPHLAFIQRGPIKKTEKISETK